MVQISVAKVHPDEHTFRNMDITSSEEDKFRHLRTCLLYSQQNNSLSLHVNLPLN